MTIEKIPTFCRVCESSCGLLAEREDDTILSLRPDKAHPVTGGFACPKGLLSLDIHRDEDRLDYPLRRVNGRMDEAGIFERQSWDQCAHEISGRLKTIIQKYGDGAVAAYSGNPTAFNSLLGPAFSSFCRQIGIRRTFSSGTQDCTNKIAAGEAVFGTTTLHPIPDIDHTDYLLIIGENPKISHMSFISLSNPMAKLKAAKKRGTVIRFVNPRRIESADGVGDVIQIKPDTDLYFVAALLHEIERMGGFKEEVLLAHGKNVDGLKQFIQNYPPAQVERLVGIPTEVICEVAREFSQAKRASVHMSTGVNMGRQGTLTYWLVQMLSFVTGNLDREGGNYYSSGFYPGAKSGRVKTQNPYFDSPFGPLRTIMGNLPGNLMANMIDMEKDPIRALFVISGNPVLSVGGEAVVRKAFRKLELMVVLDIYRNATGEMADYLLPCADWLERGDVNAFGIGFQYKPYAQYSQPVISPCYDRKEQWWILARIEQAMGLPSVLDDEDYNPLGRLNKMLSYAGFSTDKLNRMPSGTAVLPPSRPGRFYSDWLQTEDKTVDCCPEMFDEPIQTAIDIFQELKNEPEDQLKLISLRNGFMHNSWYHNLARLKKGDHKTNPLYLNPEDANNRGIEPGGRVRVHNRWGSIEAEVNVDERLRCGVAAMAHGWGNQRTPGMKVAKKYPGVNVNRLLPCGPGSFEKISNQAHMTGIPVAIDKI